ncbi:O-antigen polymerase [Fimbriimonas ginsengisoli]|uniref:Oligosaccharide repeat unit polymerase n=1 Tax=Fimbriimonas ginsengisoli Gsoil 348 TaxID=661478 RepID=A0A068NY49_FIMGI|nr:O-antigen polymerase [Fimbriimonas ginsengisoli]AIE86639.1 hypothetical protein OP10G_3271 [Fimbriimonas ginsengisoli Gsoil 348]
MAFNLPLAYFSPRWMLIGGILVWLFFRISTFYLTYDAEISERALLLFAGYIGAFVLGTYFVPSWISGRRHGNVEESVEDDRPAADGLAWLKTVSGPGVRAAANVLFALTLLFVIMRVYDLLFGRGLLELGSIQATRYADNSVDQGRSTSAVGFISGMGYPIAIPMMVFCVLFHRFLHKWQWFTGISLFLTYAVYVVISGNRYIVLGPLFLLLVASAFAHGRLMVSRKAIYSGIAIFALAFFFVVKGTTERDVLKGAMSAVESASIAPERWGITPSEGFMTWLNETDPTTAQTVWGWASLAWYANHGVYEFSKTVNHADPSRLYWGVAQYSIAFYFFRLLGLSEVNERGWREQFATFGVYSTFFGPTYIDFGIILGFAYLFALGVFTQFLYRRALQGSLLPLLLYPFFASVIFNFMTNNLIQSGLGVPIMANIVGAYLIAKYCIQRKNGNHLNGSAPALPA